MGALAMLQITKPILSIEDAHVSYAQRPALAGLSLELYAGELLALLGPNGAGKTTLINCLAQRQRLDRGRIHVRAEGRLADVLGIVPQDIALYADLSVLQNLQVFGRLHGLAGRVLGERIEEALRWASLDERRRSLVRTLSGGMQRRLNIACSVLHRPRILLLDEPTVGVDPQSRERIYTMIEQLREQETAVLLTTHQLDEIQTRCDRLAIVDAGTLIDVGTYDELLQRSIGSAQQVSIRFASAPSRLPARLRPDPSGLGATGTIINVLEDVPRLIAELAGCGASIDQLSLQPPTLQHMFLHLTGKELRE